MSLDNLIHSFLLGEIDFNSLKKTAEEKKITQMQTGILDMPTIAFHWIITDCKDKIMILEPGIGRQESHLYILEIIIRYIIA